MAPTLTSLGAFASPAMDGRTGGGYAPPGPREEPP